MHRHSDATLMGMTKKQLVSYVRMAEHNYDVAREQLHQQAENVKDWMPVVRCKDCNFWRRCGETNKGECDGLEIYGSMKEDDFCSYGERKEKDA